MRCGWAHGSIIMPLPTHVSTQMLEVPWNSTSLLGDKGWHCAVVEALTQYGVDPTSPPNIWKVFDNFHMMLMGTWNLHHVTTTTCVRPDVGSPIKSCITPGLQRIPLCSGWGSPKMEGIPHPLPTYERCLKTFICCGWAHGSIIMPLSPHVLTQIWEVSWNHYHCWASATQDSIVWWLRL